MHQAITDRNRIVRQAAVEALASLESIGPESLTFLLNSINESDYHVRQAAVEALLNLENINKESLEVLLRATQNCDIHNIAVKRVADQVLQNLKAKDDNFFEVLCKATEDDVRYAAVQALGKLYAGNAKIVAVLSQAAQDPVKDIHEAAQKALEGYRQQIQHPGSSVEKDHQ